MPIFDHGRLLSTIRSAVAALRPEVVRVYVSAAVGAKIGFGLDERARVGEDIEDALIEGFWCERLC